jgi:hypothetical protein
MRVLLGNKARILDIIEEYSKYANIPIKVVISTTSEDSRQIYISAVYPPKDASIQGTARLEKYICINYAPRFAITDAHSDFFKDSSVHIPTIATVIYRDWVFPSNKKLYEIMKKLF